jgi:hypothetical protein
MQSIHQFDLYRIPNNTNDSKSFLAYLCCIETHFPFIIISVSRIITSLSKEIFMEELRVSSSSNGRTLNIERVQGTHSHCASWVAKLILSITTVIMPKVMTKLMK